VSVRDRQDALRNLALLSLITLSLPSPSVSSEFQRIRVHALVQRAAIEHLNLDQITTLITTVADALIQIWPAIERDPQLGQILRANTTALAGRYESALWTPTGHPVLLQRAGRSLGESGFVATAIDYSTQLRNAATRHLGPDHPDTLTARNNLAYWQGAAGNLVGAATAFEELLADYLRVLGPDHPDTLTARHNLANWRRKVTDP